MAAILQFNNHARSQISPTMSLVLSELREHIHLPDPTPLYCILAAAVANRMEGPAFSFMLLGPAGCGGTLMTELLLRMKGVHSVSKLSAESLLSGTPIKEMKKIEGARGGLLKMWKPGDIMLIKDFTAILTMRPDAKAETLGALRDISDGHYERGVGSDGGKLLSWHGKLGIISKCTPEFDKHYAAITAMGDRFLYYRYPEDVNDTEKYASLKAIEELRWDMGHAQELVAALIEETVDEGLAEDVEIKRGRAEAIVMIAKMCSRARAGVTRDRFNKEIMSVDAPEKPMRLSKALTLMYKSLRGIGLGDKLAWSVVKAVGLSTMPENRGMVIRDTIKCLSPVTMGGKGESWVTVEDLKERYGYGRDNMVRTAVEDLMVHGVLRKYGIEEKNGKGRPKVRYRFSEEALEWWKKGWVE